MNGGTFPQSNYWWHVPLRLRVHSAGFIFWRKRSVWFARVFSWTITSWACASNRNRLWNELDDWMNHLRYEIYDNYATILRSPRVSLFPRLQLSQAASATYSICPHAVSVCLSRSCIVSKCVKLMLRLWIWSFTVWLFCSSPKSNLSETFYQVWALRRGGRRHRPNNRQTRSYRSAKIRAFSCRWITLW